METKKYETNDKRGIQKRGTQIIIIASVVVLAIMISSVAYVLIQNNNGKMDLLSTENTELVYELSARDSVINEMLGEFRTIENTLDIIKRKRNLLTDISEESSMNQSIKDGIIHDIQVLNSLIDESKTRIDYLNKKLKQSGIKIKQFEAKILELEGVVDEKIADISALKGELVKRDFKLTELNKSIDTLQLQLEDKIALIKVREEELKTQKESMYRAYIARGTFKELKEKGLVKKEGGFLFLGRNKNIQSEFSADDFQRVNIAETNQIPINARKMALISEHPGGSYDLVREDDKIAYLKIEDPSEFWKISKYLVVETRN